LTVGGKVPFIYLFFTDRQQLAHSFIAGFCLVSMIYGLTFKILQKAANSQASIHTLLEQAALLTDRYASQAAVEHALDASEATNPDYSNRVPGGSPWAAPARSTTVGFRSLEKLWVTFAGS
jgi:hypothetical protein